MHNGVFVPTDDWGYDLTGSVDDASDSGDSCRDDASAAQRLVAAGDARVAPRPRTYSEVATEPPPPVKLGTVAATVRPSVVKTEPADGPVGEDTRSATELENIELELQKFKLALLVSLN